MEYNLIRKLIMNVALLCSNRIVSVSNAVKSFWREKLLFCDNKVIIIYNAPGFISKGNKVIPKNNIAKKEKILLLCLANIHPIKGHIYAIKAVHELCKNSNRYHLNIYGKNRDGYSRELEKMIKELQLEENVTLKGPTDKPQVVLMDHDILLMPSLSEGFPLVSVEGMSVGIPVIASDIPSHREIFGNDTYGIVINTKDTLLFRDAIFSLTNDSEKYLSYSKQGYIRSQEFTLDAMSRKYNLLYQNKI